MSRPPRIRLRRLDELVLAYAGASLSRDAYDEIVVNDTRNGKATFGNRGIIDSQDEVVYSDGSRAWPLLKSAKAPRDSDGDGIPDVWEKSHGLNPKNPADGRELAASGYTNLEEYMNSLVSPIMEAGLAGGKVMGVRRNFHHSVLTVILRTGHFASTICFQRIPMGNAVYTFRGSRQWTAGPAGDTIFRICPFRARVW